MNERCTAPFTIGTDRFTETKHSTVERDVQGNITGTKSVSDWVRHEPDEQVAQIEAKAQLSAEIRLEQILAPAVDRLARALDTVDRAVQVVAETRVALREPDEWVPVGSFESLSAVERRTGTIALRKLQSRAKCTPDELRIAKLMLDQGVWS